MILASKKNVNKPQRLINPKMEIGKDDSQQIVKKQSLV
jgi:hypothetical protein